MCACSELVPVPVVCSNTQITDFSPCRHIVVNEEFVFYAIIIVPAKHY